MDAPDRSSENLEEFKYYVVPQPAPPNDGESYEFQPCDSFRAAPEDESLKPIFAGGQKFEGEDHPNKR